MTATSALAPAWVLSLAAVAAAAAAVHTIRHTLLVPPGAVLSVTRRGAASRAAGGRQRSGDGRHLGLRRRPRQRLRQECLHGRRVPHVQLQQRLHQLPKTDTANA